MSKITCFHIFNFILLATLVACKSTRQNVPSETLSMTAGSTDLFGGYAISQSSKPTLASSSQQGRCVENRDFDIQVEDRKAALTVLAIHGGDNEGADIDSGAIEIGTSAIASMLATQLAANLYDFKAHAEETCRASDTRQTTERPIGLLHITASNFDEPRAVALVSAHPKSVAIHGYGVHSNWPQDKEIICVGGMMTTPLVDKFIAAIRQQHDKLVAEGFDIEPIDARNVTDPAGACYGLSGKGASNIVNRNSNQSGLQLELSRKLRLTLADTRSQQRYPALCLMLGEAIRSALN